MPIDFKDTDGGVGCIITAWDHLRDQEFADLFRRFYGQAEEKYKRYRYTIADYQQVSKLDVTIGSIRRMSEQSKEGSEINPDAVVAIVTRNPLIFGLTRMWMTFVDGVGWEIKIFKDLDEAMAWTRERVRELYGLENLTFDGASVREDVLKKPIADVAKDPGATHRHPDHDTGGA